MTHNSISIEFWAISFKFYVLCPQWSIANFVKNQFQRKRKNSIFSNFLKFVITQFLLSFLSFVSFPWKFCFYAYKWALIILGKLSFRAKRKKFNFWWSIKNTWFATKWEHKIKYFIFFFKNEPHIFIIQVGTLIPTYNSNQNL